MSTTGADVIIEALRREDVEYVFGLPGGAVMPIFDSIFDSKIKLVLTRHEQGRHSHGRWLCSGHGQAWSRAGHQRARAPPTPSPAC